MNLSSFETYMFQNSPFSQQNIMRSYRPSLLQNVENKTPFSLFVSGVTEVVGIFSPFLQKLRTYLNNVSRAS